MSGTRAGGLKAAAKNLEKNPNFYADIGRKGGTQSTTGGFYANKDLAREAGSKGGYRSRRGHKFIEETATHMIYSSNTDGTRLRIKKES